MNLHRAAPSPKLVACLLAIARCLSATESKSDEPVEAENSAADSMLGKEAGQARDDNGLKMKLVWCPPGKFKMGSPESEKDRYRDEGQVEVTANRHSVRVWIGTGLNQSRRLAESPPRLPVPPLGFNHAQMLVGFSCIVTWGGMVIAATRTPKTAFAVGLPLLLLFLWFLRRVPAKVPDECWPEASRPESWSW